MLQCHLALQGPQFPFLPFQVTLVDKDLLKFLKLEELILSANKIEEIDANNLPRTLKVQVLYRVLESAALEVLPLNCPPQL